MIHDSTTRFLKTSVRAASIVLPATFKVLWDIPKAIKKMSEIDITGLNKKQLLKELWKSSKPAAFFTMSGIPAPDCNDAEIDRVFLTENCYADYLCGRVIKTSFKTNKLKPFGYDRYNGAGAMQKVVDAVRASSALKT